MKEATGSGIVLANAEDTASKANAANSKHSGIFSTNAEDTTSEANTGIRVYQVY